jgi:hypothetical protein
LNRNRLRGKIAETGLRQKQILRAAGMTYMQFWRKMTQNVDFTIGEVEALTRVLGLTPAERDEIFFAPNFTDSKVSPNPSALSAVGRSGPGAIPERRV